MNLLLLLEDFNVLMLTDCKFVDYHVNKVGDKEAVLFCHLQKVYEERFWQLTSTAHMLVELRLKIMVATSCKTSRNNYTESANVLSILMYKVITCLHWVSSSSLESPVSPDSLMSPTLSPSPLAPSVLDVL